MVAPHYQSLSMRNFRGFKKADNIRLAPLTFLVGPNSSGKSSLFDALLLITQSGFSPNDSAVPNWGGPLIDLGSYNDAVYGHNARLSIEFHLELTPTLACGRITSQLDKPMGISFRLRTISDDPIGELSQIEVWDLITHEKLKIQFKTNKMTIELLGIEKQIPIPKFRRPPNYLEDQIDEVLQQQANQLKGRKTAWRRIQQFASYYGLGGVLYETQRVSSGRAAPKRWYPLTDVRFQPRGLLYGPTTFDAVDPSMLDEARKEDLYFSPWRRKKIKIRDTLKSVLKKLDIATQIDSFKLSPYHSSINVKDSITGVTSNLIDVGYGASQVIPILKACLSEVEGPLFVEQPEIHLHPKAQGIVAELLCRTSLHRQVIVETHSVHMINAARILVAKGEIKPEHVVINYVERKSTGSQVLLIPILENGDFGREWPEGFFDERYEDTMHLLKLKSVKGK